MSDQWVISIGTGPAQRPLIEAARRRSLKVIGIDRAPDDALVDMAVTCSTHEADTAAAHAERLAAAHRIVGILARTSGPAVVSAARCAAILGLPGICENQAQASLSKSTLARQAEALGIAVPDYNCQVDMPVWIDGADLIIKPDQPLYGKRNVYRVSDADAAAAAFAACQEESLNDQVLYQQPVGDEDVTVAVAAHRGAPLWTFALAEFVDLRDGRFEGQGVAGPWLSDGGALLGDMTAEAVKLVDAWEATGFCFFSFRVDTGANAFYLYEANPGLCGDAIADRLFPALWPDVNFFDLDVALMLGEQPVFPDFPAGAAAVIGDEVNTAMSVDDLRRTLESII